MKNFIIISVIALFICNCNDSGSSSHGTKGLKFNPDTLTIDDKYNLPAIDYTILLNSSPVQVKYSIIYVGTVNSKNYVGIAMMNNDQVNPFKLKIYFDGTSVPTAGTEINTSNNLKIKAKYGSTEYEWQSGSLTFDSVTKKDITTDNEKSYTTYEMNIISTVNTPDLTFPNKITLRLAGGD